MYAIYDETEPYFRDHPREGFEFVPVSFNAQFTGRLACFKRVAELHKEATDDGEHAWLAVLWRDRKCPKWSKYEPGFSPREQFAETRARRFARQLSVIAWSLALLGILVGALVMPTDAAGCQLLKNAVGWAGLLQWFHCK